MLCHKNTFLRLGTLAHILCPEALARNADLHEGCDFVDEYIRTSLQTAISIIRKQLSGRGLEIREIKIAGDRRVKAYGLFDSNTPDSSETYLERARWERLVLSYKS
jgi:hypothetical protein